MRRGLNGEMFSTEKGNLYNKHSFKYSGALYRMDGPDGVFMLRVGRSSLSFAVSRRSRQPEHS
jgi:hypothetical protein